MNIDQTEDNFKTLIKLLNFLRHLGVDYQFDHDCPEYLGYINTIPEEHGINKYDMEYFHANEPVFETVLESMGLRVQSARMESDEFILEEIRK